jgi:GNAT superfamily N-acetyltransferase
MPTITVRLDCPVARSFRACQVAGMFDVPLEERLAHELVAEVPGLEEPWTIGVIAGPSGSGKTTLARAAFGSIYESPPWPSDGAMIECLDGGGASMKTLAHLLVGAGLGSVPAWLKPYHVLSTGERFRADLARAVFTCGDPVLVIDEFAGSLDRAVAQTSAAALQRLLRSESVTAPVRKPARLVALTCHDEIAAWLEPDWVLRLDGAGGATLVRGRLRRPRVRLAVHRVPQATWRMFARHHYLAGGLAASATCYGAFWQDEDHPVAFCAAVAALGWKRAKRITRLVTLPEFQGLGIGSQLAEAVAEHEASRGNRVTITASHPAIIAHCSRSPRWRYVELKKTGSTRQRLGEREIRSSLGRAVAGFEFVG